MQREVDESGALEGDLKRLAASKLPGIQPHTRQLVTMVIQDLSGLLDAVFADVDDYFFSRAETADDTTDHGSYFESMRVIRIQRKSIKTRFRNDLVNAASAYWSNRSGKTVSPGTNHLQRPASAPLSVVTDDEFEVSVAISGMAEKGNARYGRIFRTLETTLSGIEGGETAAKTRHPLAIATIIDTFITATRDLSLELPAMISLLKLFERHVVDYMGRVYTSALRNLEEAGITIAGESDKTSVAGREPKGTIEFSELQRRLRTVSNDAIPNSTDPVNVDQLLDTVSSVQHQYLERLPVFESARRRPPSLQAFLLNAPASAGGFRDAGRDQRDMLKLVSDLFEYIFKNENLSVASKALIARIQIPVLKVALVDDTLFSDSRHPAREFVNRLSSDGIGWPASEALLKRNPLYLAAERMVAQLNESTRPTVELFADLLAEWSDLASRHQRRSTTAVRRLNESVRGKAKLEAAKRIVQTTVNESARDIQLPHVVAEFLTEYWTPAMVVACVKHGTQVASWDRLCDAFHRLLAVFDQSSDRQEFDAEALIQDLRECLRDYGTDQSMADTALGPVDEALKRMGDPTLAGYEVEDLEVLEEIVLTDVADPGLTPDTDDEDYRLVHLEPGSWAEFHDSEGSRRYRLAIVNENQLYIFTDDSGRKTCELSRPKLLAGLVSGSIKIVHEEPPIDKAIDELIANLMSYSPVKR